MSSLPATSFSWHILAVILGVFFLLLLRTIYVRGQEISQWLHVKNEALHTKSGRKDVNTQYLGGTPVLSADFFPYALADSGLCLPSMQVAWFGFSCIYHTMLTIFVSLFLFLSVSLSRSRENSTERFYWWFPVGIIFILFVFVELFLSAQYFIYYAEYVIAIRFPYLQQSSLWKQMMVKYGYLGQLERSNL
uniref:Uncharacterized protein n=1 Tax=Cryptomonas curvata TaxID=233186 RepID=A0A7S0MZY2_9CRYP|mmetsp:Transcript_55958/g.117080  ORF Transcript_55958/g.117080 Transcript_55958/m.117080 type:complete len:191 (+) Transcript_55958:256-828(+)